MVYLGRLAFTDTTKLRSFKPIKGGEAVLWEKIALAVFLAALEEVVRQLRK